MPARTFSRLASTLVRISENLDSSLAPSASLADAFVSMIFAKRASTSPCSSRSWRFITSRVSASDCLAVSLSVRTSAALLFCCSVR